MVDEPLLVLIHLLIKGLYARHRYEGEILDLLFSKQEFRHDAINALPWLLLSQENVQRAEAAVALARGHIGDDVLAKMAGKPCHDGVLQPGALDLAKTAPMNDLDAAQAFFKRVLDEFIEFFFCFWYGAAVQIEEGLD